MCMFGIMYVCMHPQMYRLHPQMDSPRTYMMRTSHSAQLMLHRTPAGGLIPPPEQSRRSCTRPACAGGGCAGRRGSRGGCPATKTHHRTRVGRARGRPEVMITLLSCDLNFAALWNGNECDLRVEIRSAYVRARALGGPRAAPAIAERQWF